MSKQEFENYMALLSRLLRLNGVQDKKIRDELRDHLEFRVADLVESGTDPNEAVRKALEEFGDAASLAKHFQSIFKSNKKRWVMRFATFSVAGSFVAVLLIMAMWPSPARFGAPSDAVAVQDQDPFGAGEANTNDTSLEPQPMSSEALEQLLKKPVHFFFDDSPMSDVLGELRDTHAINILLDQSAKDDSLSEDTVINFYLENVRASTALRMMLAPHNATYMIDDGVLVIISLDVSYDPLFLRSKIFKVADLLAYIEKNDPKVGQPLGDQSDGGGGFGVGASVESSNEQQPQRGGGVFSIPSRLVQTQEAETTDNSSNSSQPDGSEIRQIPDPQKLPAEDEADAQSVTAPRKVITAEYLLQDLIQTAVVPEDWAETNGDGTISIVSGLMVVNQTEVALEEIDRLLAEFRHSIE